MNAGRIGGALIVAAALGGTALRGVAEDAAAIDVDDRVDALLPSVSSADVGVHKKALDGLRALGDAAVEPLLRHAGLDPGTPESGAALAALCAIDPDEALARVETSRSRWASYRWLREIPERKGQTVVDFLTTSLLAARKDAWSKPVPLETAVLADPFRIPPWAEHRITDSLPSALVWADVPVRVKGASLEIDAALDGRFATKVDAARPQVVSVGPDARARKVIIHRRAGAWYAASPLVARATVDGTAIEFLDAQADGVFDGPDDLVRFGDGAFRPLKESEFGWTPKGLVRFRLKREGGALTVATIREPDPRWEDGGAVAGMDALNRWRNAAGLAPQRIDEARWRACGEHHEYWRRNGFSAHDQDPERPAATADGALAGKSSSVWASPGPEEFVTRIAGSVLHRSSTIGRASEGVGFFAGRSGCLLWGAQISGASRDFPVLVPGAGQTGVPLQCEPEAPNPERDPAFYGKARGFTISATWSGVDDRPFGGVGGDVRLELTPEGAKAPLPGTLFCAATPYHSGFRYGYPDDSVIFVADTPLAPGTTYVARVRADGEDGPIDFSWRFRTR